MSDISIYKNDGTDGAPVLGELLASQTGGTTTYLDYINAFSYLDATTTTTSSDTGEQGSLFSLVDGDDTDDFSLEFINDVILPDLIYEDFDLGADTVVDRVRFYTGDDPNAEGAVVATVMPLEDDVTTVGEVDAYVEQIFG